MQYHADESSAPPTADQETLPASDAASYCTFAVTGNHTAFQPIFICHECFNKNEAADIKSPLCICQACADQCHDGNDHDVEYIGMGPCYCDCDHVGDCTIFQASQVQAERLGVVAPAAPPTAYDSATTSVDTRKSMHEDEAKESQPVSLDPSLCQEETTVQDVFDIPTLHDITMTTCLVRQAEELIRYSKQSFWVDETTASTDDGTPNKLCGLEQLAWSIYQHHVKHYASKFSPQGHGGGGAEWWVQVKDASATHNGGIDLHYDKDEALADVFGLGSFPTLSTVTYLTRSTSTTLPTIVLDHTYAQGEDNLMRTLLISRPQFGKHLVFDGTLLHGAPSQEDLKPRAADGSKLDESGKEPTLRVTFLVNIWKNNRPAKVQTLDPEIRSKLLTLRPTWHELEAPLEMIAKVFERFTLEKDDDLPESLRHRIELPFVTKGITWEDQLNLRKDEGQDAAEDDDSNDEDGGGLVVVTFPPPPTEDTVLVKFGPGLQAYLDYPHRGASAWKDFSEKESEHESGYI